MQNSFARYSFVFVVLAVAFFCRLFLISVYKIPTESMAPTVLPGDIIMGSQISYGIRFPWSETTHFQDKPKKGDLVIVSFKNKPAISYIKRVAGIEGDEVETQDGKQKVGPNEVYVLSDNPNTREDSRDFGLVSLDQIESQAKFVWFSFSPESKIRWTRILTQLK